MIVIDEILTAVNTAMDLAKKHQDKETAEKLVEIYSSILEVKKENEELRKKIEGLEAKNNKENDLEKLAEITEINPFTENDEMVQIPPPPAPFKISDDLKKDSIGLKKKYDENIAAIKLLKQLEQEDREATDEEKNILAKYNGWGGLS